MMGSDLNQSLLQGHMVTSIGIKKVTIKNNVVLDLEVWMDNPDDYNFSPRLSLVDNILSIYADLDGDGVISDDEILASVELDDEAQQLAERDRVIEARIKFSVHGMHGTLLHKTPLPQTGPNAKKLAEPRWKVMLPLL
tara:strand:- start:359 stop:772 length:414 start_codon:yes stop_codon:yes gene_type:complete